MRTLIFLLAVLFAPWVASAADDESTSTHGDFCFGNLTSYTKSSNDGAYRVVCNRLCETIDSDDTCSEWDFDTDGWGIPDKVFIELYSAADCSGAYVVDINQSSVTGPPANKNAHDVTRLDVDRTGAWYGLDLPILQFWQTTFETMTACTDVTVLIHSHFKQ